MHGFRTRLSELGLILGDEELRASYHRFLEIADRKKEVYDEDLFAIVSDQLGRQQETFVLEYYNILSGNTAVPTATVRVRTGDDTVEEAATGDGPVDAVFRAIDRAVGMTTVLREYNVQAVTPGKQALGEVTVNLEIDGRRSMGHGSSTDIIEASAYAYVNALNWHKAWNRSTEST
jgi:2-isopropylmalate synthase